MAKKLVVGITQGDGNGIGYEVIIKSLADERMLDLCTPVIYGSSKIFGFYKKQIHNIDQINTNVITSAKDVHQKRVNIVNCLPENVFVEENMALIAVVGRGMVKAKGTAARIFMSLANASVNIRMIDQGSSELNIIIGVDANDYVTALGAIYNEFVK